MKPKILIIDTLYPDFLRTVPFDPSSTYERELRKVLDRCFGTFDSYSRNLRALGWDAVDVIANHRQLQQMWHNEHRLGPEILRSQVEYYDPDVVFAQDLSLPIPLVLNARKEIKFLIAGQLSCPWPGDDVVSRFDVIFTSFPHYVPRIEKLGVRAIYNPLAFEPGVFERLSRPPLNEPPHYVGVVPERERIHDVVFIGGVGNPSHWKYGMEVLETMAREIPTFKWWGYGAETLPANSALRDKYRGPAFGLDMYSIFLQSKIVLNRHGEVAEGYANNQRLYESTGCGAMLLTENAPNLADLFSDREVESYDSPGQAVGVIRYYLKHEQQRQVIAANGQRRTLRDHTYEKRMKTVSDSLKEMLVNV